LSVLEQKMPTIKEAEDYLKQMGVRSLNKTNLAKQRARPFCFRPDGSMATINTKN